MGKVFSFDDVDETNAPQSVLLDTGFLLNLTHHITEYPKSRLKDYDSVNKARQACNDFLLKLVGFKTRLITCDIVHAEFCHEIYKDVLQKKDTMGWKNLYDRRPELIRSGHPKIKKAYESFKAFFDDKMIQTGSIVRDVANEIMRRLDMCPNDSYIASIAIKNNIDGIATFNPKDFNKIAKQYPINVYLPKELTL